MSRKVTRLVHADKYVAEVTVESIPDDGALGPYLSLDAAMKDDLGLSLRWKCLGA